MSVLIILWLLIRLTGSISSRSYFRYIFVEIADRHTYLIIVYAKHIFVNLTLQEFKNLFLIQ